MPDLKSELQKLEHLKFDDDEGTPEVVVAEEESNLTRQIWDIVAQNHGITSKQVADQLGVGNDAVSTRLTQMFKRGWVDRKPHENGTFLYTTNFKSYPAKPMKEALKRATAVRKANLAAAQQKKKAAKRPKLSAPRKETAVSNSTGSFNLDALTLGQARELYTQLKRMFD